MKPHLHIHFLGKKFHSFHFFGVTGLIFGTLLGFSLVLYAGLSVLIAILLCGVGMLTALVLVYGYKLMVGREDLVYYQHEIVILATSAFTLWLLNQPILPYLDILILSIGMVLTFGRLGCFSVGCCHGKPSRIGTIYSYDHAKAGFPGYYVGIKLFPIQLVESCWVFCTTVAGVFLILSNYPAGTVVLVYSVIYGMARFIFEFYRGDPERPYLVGFSEAQWTTLLLIEISLLLSYINILPFYMWHYWVGFGLPLVMLVIFSFRHLMRGSFYNILLPKNAKEIILGLNGTKNFPSPYNQRGYQELYKTKFGLVLSCGNCETEHSEVDFYTFSSHNRRIPMTAKLAYKLAAFISIMKHNGNHYKIIDAGRGVFHILFNTKKAYR